MMICSIPDCGKKVKARGFCSAHAERFRLHGDPLGSGPSPKRKLRRRHDIVLNCKTCSAPFHPWGGREATSAYCSVICSQPARDAAVRNTDADFDARVSKAAGGCWEWTGSRNHSGYGLFGIDGRLVRAHRYSYERTNGPIPAGLFVCHTCDNPPCVNPDHLWLGRHAENAADMVAKGRAHKGPSVHSDAHPLSKLTKAQARAIRSDPRTAREIAPEYGIGKSLVWGIKKGTHWKYA